MGTASYQEGLSQSIVFFPVIKTRGLLPQGKYSRDLKRRLPNPSVLFFLVWRRYVPVAGPKSLVGSFAFGVGFGLVGLLVWCVPAVLISSIVFAAGHTVPEWPAALAYGILISILWIIRKDLFSCIIAHGTTNLTLALYVYFTGHSELW